MVARANEYRSVAAVGELEQAKLVRAIDSQRQLQEVLADFWNNHFNIDVKKNICRVYKVPEDVYKRQLMMFENSAFQSKTLIR